MFESQLVQIPAPGTLSFIGQALRHFMLYKTQKPWSWAHISVQKPQGARGLSRILALGLQDMTLTSLFLPHCWYVVLFITIIHRHNVNQMTWC